jgi:hypothetical protein
MRRALSWLRGAVTLCLLAPLRLYKALVSPLLPPVCRFHPSCSVYAMGALGVHGPVKGLWLAARRIARCHPFHRGGLDPVPPRDGRRAEEVLAESFPFIAQKLATPPPPYLAALSPPATPAAASAPASSAGATDAVCAAPPAPAAAAFPRK